MADEKIVTSIVATSDFSNLIADVQRVTTSLFKLQQEFAGANRALAGQIDAANAMFNQTMLKTGQYSSHFVSLTSDVEKFGKNLDSGRLKLKDYFRVYQDHIRTSGGLIRDLARQQVQLQNAVLQPLGRNAQGLMQYNVHIPRGLDLTKNKTSLLKQELQIMNKVIQDGGVQLINWGKNTQWAGRQLTVGLTLPLVAFGKAAADAFRVADQELTRLTKVYGDVAGTSAAELSKVRKEVAATAKELSSAMGVNFAETISLAADIAATGKTGNELLASVSETTRLAVLGEVDRQEAMKATLAIQSAFKSNTEELAESINFLNAVENQTSTTLNDLVEAIPKAGPVIKGLGGDIEDLALYLTAMREGGINASEGANALKSALASLINPTDVAVKKFAGFGIDLLGIVNKNAGSTTDTLFALQAALDRLNPLQKQQAIEQLFGKFQYSRLNALFENLGRQGSQTLQVLDLMKASASELEAVAGRELTAVTESAAGRYKRAVESLKADLAGVGDQFLDIATKFINVLNKIIDFGQKLPDPIKKLLAFGGAFTAIIGPVIMLTGVLANFFGYIIKGIGHFKALFKGAEGFRLLTPEILAAKAAGSQLSDEFYSDALAADTLRMSIRKLSEDLALLQKNALSAKTATSGLGQTITTAAGTPIVTLGGKRVADPTHPLIGPETRAAAHLNPRDPNNPATLFGLTLQPVPVNRRIGKTPQVLMTERLDDIEGLTSVGGVSTGVVASEHARYQALMGTLGMLSKKEVAELKKTIRMGGSVSADFMATFDDILPITQELSANAAAQSAAIVAELRAGKMSVVEARAAIMAVNAQLEKDMGISVSAYAASRGKTIDLTKAPLIDQPLVDASGKPNTRGMYRKGIFAKVMAAVGRATGTKTYGGPYSIETTKPQGLNKGGNVRGYIGGGDVYTTNGLTVPGPNVNADVVPAMLTPGEFVLTRDVVAQQGSDAVEALHRGQAVIVPVVGANKGGKIPGIQYLNTAGSVLARAAGAAQTKRRTSVAEIYAQRTQLGPEASRYYYNPFGRSGQGQHEDRAHAFYSVKEAAARGHRPITGYFGIASVNKHNQIQHRLSTRLGTRDVNPVTDITAVSETIPDIFTRGGAGNWFAKNGMLDDGIVDAYKIKSFLDHVEDFARTKKWDTKRFGPPPLGFLGLTDPSSSVKVSELREYVEYLMSGKVTAVNKHGIILNDAEALMSTGRYTQREALDEAEKIYRRAMAEGDNDWSYRDKRMDITEEEYPFMIQGKNRGGRILKFNRGGMVPGYNGGGGVSRASLLARLGAKFKYEGKTSEGFDSLQTYRIKAMDPNGGRKYFGHIPGLSNNARGALYNATLEFFNSSIIKGDKVDGRRLFVPRHMLTAMPTIASNALTWNRGIMTPEDILILEGIKGKGSSLGGSVGSSMNLSKVYQDVFKANRGGRVPGYNRGGYARGVQNKNAGGFILKLLAALGISMAGQQAGEKVGGGAGQAISMGSSILPFMFMGMPSMGGATTIGQRLGFGTSGTQLNAFGGTAAQRLSPMKQSIFAQSTPGIGRFATSLGVAATSGNVLTRTVTGLLIGISRLSVVIGGAAAAVYGLYKVWSNYQKTQKLSAAEFGMTAEMAEKAGVKYVNYTQKLKDAVDAQKLAIAEGKLAFQSMTSAGTPFDLTITEYKKLKKEVKETMATQIEMINELSNKDVSRVATQLKQQLVAAGMSAEDAAKRVYTLLQMSNKAGFTIRAMSSPDFMAVTNAQTAASGAVKSFNYAKTFENTKDQAAALNTALQAIDNSIKDIYSKAEAAAKKKKEDFDTTAAKYEAEKRTLDQINSKVRNREAIGTDLLANLVKEDAAIIKIANSQDTVVSLWQKMQIAARGYTGLLNNLNQVQTQRLYDLTLKVSQAVEEANQKETGLLYTQYKNYNTLIDQIKRLESAAKGQSVREQINARDRIRALDKEIKRINDKAEAQKKALREEAQAEDIALRIEQQRLEYQKRLSAGDFSGAAEAQIELQRLQKEQQLFLTEQAIEDKRLRDVAPLEKEKERLQKEQEDLADAAALAGESLEALRRRADKQKEKIDAVNAAMTEYQIAIMTGGKNLEGAAAKFIKAVKDAGIAIENEYTYVGGGRVVEKNSVVDIAQGLLDKFGGDLTTILAQKGVTIETDGDIYIGGKKFNIGEGSKNNPYIAGKVEDIPGGLGVRAGDASNKPGISGSLSAFGTKRDIGINSVSQQIKRYADIKGYKIGDHFVLTEGNIKDGTLKNYKFKVRDKDGNVDLVEKYQDGGLIRGPGTGTSDSILAEVTDNKYAGGGLIRVSNGEYIWSKKAIDNAGGPQAVDAMHQYFRRSPAKNINTPGMFADGGKVDHGYISTADYFRRLGDLSVNFQTDKFILPLSELKELEEIAEKIKKSKVKELLVRGYADKRGSVVYNKALSMKRAVYVANMLKSMVPGVNFIPQAIGEEDSDNSLKSMSKKRRVSIEFPYQSGGLSLPVEPRGMLGSVPFEGLFGGGLGFGGMLTMRNGGLIPGFKDGGFLDTMKTSYLGGFKGLYDFLLKPGVNALGRLLPSVGNARSNTALAQQQGVGQLLKNRLGDMAIAGLTFSGFGGGSPAAAAGASAAAPRFGMAIGGLHGRMFKTNKQFYNFITKVYGKQPWIPRVFRAEDLPKGVGGQYVPRFSDEGFGGANSNEMPFFVLPKGKFAGQTAVHEFAHHIDFSKNISLEKLIDKLRASGQDDLADDYLNVFEAAEAKKKGLGFASIEDHMIETGNIRDLAWMNGVAESFATETAYNAYRHFLISKSLKDKFTALQIGNAYSKKFGLPGYYSNFARFRKNAQDMALRRNPEFLRGMVDAAPNLPERTKEAYLAWANALEKHGVSGSTAIDSPQWKAFLDYVYENNLHKFKDGGHIGAMPTGGRNPLLRYKNKATDWLKSVLDIYADKPENPFKTVGGLPILPGMFGGVNPFDLRMTFMPAPDQKDLPDTHQYDWAKGVNQLFEQYGGRANQGAEAKGLTGKAKQVQNYVHALAGLANTYYNEKYSKFWSSLGATPPKVNLDVVDLENVGQMIGNPALMQPLTRQSYMDPWSIMGWRSQALPSGLKSSLGQDDFNIFGKNEFSAKQMREYLAGEVFSTERAKSQLMYVYMHEYGHAISGAFAEALAGKTKQSFNSIWFNSGNQEIFADKFAGASVGELVDNKFLPGFVAKYITSAESYINKLGPQQSGLTKAEEASGRMHPSNWLYRSKTFIDAFKNKDTSAVIRNQFITPLMRKLISYNVLDKTFDNRLLEDPNSAIGLIKSIISGKKKGAADSTGEYSDEFNLAAAQALGLLGGGQVPDYAKSTTPTVIPPREIHSPTDWAVRLIEALGGTPTLDSIAALRTWQLEEGGHWQNPALHNPLNTILPKKGSRKINTVNKKTATGVQAYKNWEDGLQATIETLKYKAQERGYDKIIELLLDPSAKKIDILRAIDSSSWAHPSEKYNFTEKSSDEYFNTKPYDPSMGPPVITNRNQSSSPTIIDCNALKKLDPELWSALCDQSTPEKKKIEECTPGHPLWPYCGGGWDTQDCHPGSPNWPTCREGRNEKYPAPKPALQEYVEEVKGYAIVNVKAPSLYDAYQKISSGEIRTKTAVGLSGPTNLKYLFRWNGKTYAYDVNNKQIFGYEQGAVYNKIGKQIADGKVMQIIDLPDSTAKDRELWGWNPERIVFPYKVPGGITGGIYPKKRTKVDKYMEAWLSQQSGTIHVIDAARAAEMYGFANGGLIPPIPKYAGGGYVNPAYLSSMSMPTYHNGIKYIYNDTIANLQRGEMVVPANQNPNNPFAMDAGGGTITITNNMTINASPGMDVESLAEAAARRVEQAVRIATTKSGQNRNMSRRYA